MDGFKKRLNASLQFKLSMTLSLAILVTAIVAGGFSFLAAFEEAHELQDDVLRRIAWLVDGRRLAPAGTPGGAGPESGDEESRVIVQHLGAHEGGSLPLPANLADGLHTVDVRGAPFRVLARTTAAGERIVVAQASAFRNDIARDAALRTVMPLLILVPVLLLIVGQLVRQMFRSIARLSSEIDGRAGRELHPVDGSRLPAEVQPFAVAINRLLARVDQAMIQQRRFVADAAHELRTPLTALSLQAERLAQADMSLSARGRLQVLRQGIERGRKLLDQLLALARVQSAGGSPAPTLSLTEICRHVLEDLLPLAEKKRIDIGIGSTHDARVRAPALDLQALVKNLVDNAIRYTAEGGRIDLLIGTERGQAVFEIRDNGPGIPPGERMRVFDPFYRSLGSGEAGSGLGLSIVKTVADRIGARIELAWTDEALQSGLRVAVRFAAGAGSQAA